MSIRQLARLMAERKDSTLENERRQLARYLAGTSAPTPENAELLSGIVDKPTDYFTTARPERVELGAHLRDLGEVIGDLRLTLEEKGGDAAVVGELRRIGHRLEALEETVESGGKSTAKALREVGRRLAHVEEALETREREQAPKARRASEAAK